MKFAHLAPHFQKQQIISYFYCPQEFVTAIRNELMEKLPQAQMYITEPQEPLEDDLSLNSDMERGQHWAEDDEELSDIADRADSIDVSIRYNTYGTPLSPIMEEKENSNSDSTTSRSETFYNEDDEDTTSSSKPKGPLEDEVVFIDIKTNEMLITLDQPKDLLCFEELGKKDSESSSKISMAPLPSPEEEKSQSLYECSLPLQNHGGGSDEEENGEKYDEDNSVSSGEFVWKVSILIFVNPFKLDLVISVPINTYFYILFFHNKARRRPKNTRLIVSS